MTRKKVPHAPYLVKECLAQLVCVGAYLYISVAFNSFVLHDATGVLRIPAIILALLPALALYLLFRLFAGPIASLLAFLAVVGVLSSISNEKAALTTEPLVWYDLTNVNAYALAFQYATPSEKLLIVAAIVALATLILWGAVARLRQKAEHAAMWRYAELAVLALLLSHGWWAAQGRPLYPPVLSFLQDADFLYLPYALPKNVREHGLLAHLVQTSVAQVPTKATPEQRADFLKWESRGGSKPIAENVYLILCESCWYDDAHYAEAFDPLKKEGLVDVRGVSPVYGGGTVNSTFEMLTSLPANGALNGVVFQEYASQLVHGSKTVASALVKQGYTAHAYHNYYPRFWNRNVVLEKLGFSRFISIEDLNYNGPMHFPRDSVMYRQILKELAAKPSGWLFNIETVYTHGDYKTSALPPQDQYGQNLRVALGDLADFIRAARAVNPSSLFVVYGDHKPSLTKYLYASGVLTDDMFWKVDAAKDRYVFRSNVDQSKIGDVPVLIGWPKDANVPFDADRLGHLPFYCLSAVLSESFLGGGNPASSYAASQLCPKRTKLSYEKLAKSMPDWMYSLALFEQ